MSTETEELEVRYNADSLSIDIYEDGEWAYDIDLEDITTSAEALDWIMQVSEKTWMTDEAMGRLVRELDSAFRYHFDTSIQGKLCGGGKDHPFNAAEWKNAPRGPRPSA